MLKSPPAKSTFSKSELRRIRPAFNYSGSDRCACLVFARAEHGNIVPMTVDFTFGSVRERIGERLDEGCVNPIPWVADTEESKVLFVIYRCSSPLTVLPKYEKLLCRFVGPPPIPSKMSEFTDYSDVTFPREPPFGYLDRWYTFKVSGAFDKVCTELSKAFQELGVQHNRSPDKGDCVFVVQTDDGECNVNIFLADGGHSVEFQRGTMTRRAFDDLYMLVRAALSFQRGTMTRSAFEVLVRNTLSSEPLSSDPLSMPTLLSSEPPSRPSAEL